MCTQSGVVSSSTLREVLDHAGSCDVSLWLQGSIIVPAYSVMEDPDVICQMAMSCISSRGGRTTYTSGQCLPPSRLGRETQVIHHREWYLGTCSRKRLGPGRCFLCNSQSKVATAVWSVDYINICHVIS